MIKLESIHISPEFLNLIGEIDEFRGSWQVLQHLSPERLASLRKVATIESVGSSTRIEGAKLSDKEVEELLSRLEAKLFQSRDEEEVAGYADVMEQVFQHYDMIPFTENYIKQLHEMLLQFSSKDTRHRGQYKKFSNNVEAFDHTGKSLGIVFETVTPFDTPKLMEQLINWAQQTLNDKTLHPLLTIAIFVVWFLAIHPFQDGNGRLSRVLTTLLLLKTGYTYVPYSSLENIIEANKENYYLALRHTQTSFKKESPDWNPWVKFFLHALKKQKDQLAQKIARETILTQRLNPLAVQIVDLIKSHGQLSIGELQTLTHANRNTLKVQLRELVKNGHLQLCGGGRRTWYVIAKS